MYSKLFRFAWLRIRLWMQRPIQFLLLLALIPLTIYLAASILPSGDTSSRIPIGVVDQDQSDYSRLVMERLSRHPLVQVEELTEREAVQLVKQGQLEGAFIMRAGFMERLMEGERKQVVELVHSPASLSIGIIRERVASELLRLASNVQAASYVRQQYLSRQLINPEDHERIWEEAWAHSDSYWEPEPLMSIRYREFPLVPTRQDSPTGQLERERLLLCLGWLTTLVMLVAMFLQQWLVEEREQHLLPRIQSFSIHARHYLLGNSLAVLVIMLFALGLGLIMLAGKIQIPLLTNGLIISLLVSYTLFCLVLAISLSLWVKTTAQLQGMGLSIVLVTSLFGGALFPLAE